MPITSFSTIKKSGESDIVGDIKHIAAASNKESDLKLDPLGFFVILIDKKLKTIIVEYYENTYADEKKKRVVSGKIKLIFEGHSAQDLAHTISMRLPGLQTDHAIYLGRELQKAQICLEQGTEYVQE